MSLRLLCLTLPLCLLASSAAAETLTFEDPSGDDYGPGAYTYPTDAVYKRGSFDLRKVELKDKGSTVEVRITVGATIEDPWNSKSWPDPGNGFSLQMVQIYLDIDRKAGSGHTTTLPGLNATFAAADAWDKVIIVSPQAAARVKREVKAKAGKMRAAAVIPKKVRKQGKTIIATVRTSDLGGAPAASWGVQVVLQSNEGFPKGRDLLSRKVNENAGQHRFGGGNDWECDPHIIDILVPPASGSGAEKAAQKKALAYKCGSGGKAEKMAVLPMVVKATP